MFLTILTLHLIECICVLCGHFALDNIKGEQWGKEQHNYICIVFSRISFCKYTLDISTISYQCCSYWCQWHLWPWIGTGLNSDCWISYDKRGGSFPAWPDAIGKDKSFIRPSCQSFLTWSRDCVLTTFPSFGSQGETSNPIYFSVVTWVTAQNRIK